MDGLSETRADVYTETALCVGDKQPDRRRHIGRHADCPGIVVFSSPENEN